MTETIGAAGSGHPSLNLTAEEKRVYGNLLKEADPDGFGAVSGDIAVKFFERTKLPPDVLGQIWQIADVENRGFLTPSGFGVVLRLIGHAQSGRTPTAQLATQPGTLPKFEGSQIQPQAPAPPSSPAPVAPQHSGVPGSPSQPPIRVPPLNPDKVGEYSSLFEKSGAENGMLPGLTAKAIFERARLPNEVLGRIWGLSDTQGRGSLDVTEFVVAMHLLASYKSGQMRGVPNTLPPGLYEAAARRPIPRAATGSRPSSAVPGGQAVVPQFTGYGAGRPQSPIARHQIGTPLSQQSTGENWLIPPADKARFDSIFATIDKSSSGHISGEQAVEFFGNARLPEEILAQIWDLADINSEGRLNKDEFAVAMYLIRQQRGTKDGRGILPATLPHSLVPPSMRKQVIPPSQTTAPAFDAAPVTKPKSAADDLFGLDAFNPPPPAQFQTAQGTGSTDAGPFGNPPSQAASSPTASTTFKPFVPSSSFGQSLSVQPSSSPGPGQARSAQQPYAADDLLGDADPGETSKLTNETSELANLSNQVSSLSRQMTEVQNERGQTEQQLQQTSAQKRAFESRLGQLRLLYQNEIKEVKALREQLAASQKDTKRLQQDMAVIDGQHQDLSAQHQQLRAQFEADQRENASLKERIRQLNGEVDQLKPQLEKLKSDGRQQKGLVAINKKQLATNEAERDRLKAEIAGAQREAEDAAKEVEESARQVEASKKEIEEARSTSRSSVKSPPAVASPPAIASPAPSTTSNPFFRRTTTGISDRGSQDQGTQNQNQNQNTFDSIFGPSYTSDAASPAPATSFRSESPAPPVGTPPSTSTPQVVEPPAPASASQITSASLPFNPDMLREESVSSSVKVAPPTSRLSPADTPRAVTPSTNESTPPANRSTDDPFAPAAADQQQGSGQRDPDNVDDIFGKPTSEIGVPGAFPGAATPGSEAPSQDVDPLAAGAGVAAAATGHEEDKGKGPAKSPSGADDNFDEYFGGAAHQRTPSEQAAEFDSAFAGMKKDPGVNGMKAAADKEFPDIQELDDGDDDDDDDADDSSDYSQGTPMGFDDDFNAKTPEKKPEPHSAGGGQPKVASALPGHMQAERPQLQTAPSNASSLPSIERETSPPDYKEAVPDDNPNHFPREYKGLVPERGDPTSPPPTVGGVTSPPPPLSGEPPSYGPEVGHAQNQDAVEHQPAAPPKSSPFDFDSEFAGVGPAQVDEESDEDDDTFPTAKARAAEFDPTFDSPSHTRSTTAASSIPQPSTYNAQTNGSPAPPPKDDFHDINLNKPQPPPPAEATTTAQAPAASHDWDDIFSGLSDSNANASKGFEQPASPAGAGAATEAQPTVNEPAPSSPPAKPPSPSPGPERPALGRAISTTSEHDDPILKRLTAMGWSRAESLAALERFDYNIDKAADYLTFRS